MLDFLFPTNRVASPQIQVSEVLVFPPNSVKMAISSGLEILTLAHRPDPVRTISRLFNGTQSDLTPTSGLVEAAPLGAGTGHPSNYVPSGLLATPPWPSAAPAPSPVCPSTSDFSETLESAKL